VSNHRNDIAPEARAELFFAEFGTKNDPSDQLLDVVNSLGNQLGFIFGEETADKVMGGLLEDHIEEHSGEISAGGSWTDFAYEYRKMLLYDTKGGKALMQLQAYAKYGIVLDEAKSPEALDKLIRKLTKVVNHFYASCVASPWESAQPDEIGSIVNAANARRALDAGEPIAPSGLALLGGVGEAAVRNLMSKKAKGLRSEDGKVIFEDAENWLSAKKGFWDSVWQEQDFSDDSAETDAETGSFIFIPVSMDGSIFHPGVSDGNNYRVGPKNNLKSFKSYTDALRYLQTLNKPYWKRKNPTGIWTLIAGQRWERITVSELKKFEDDPERRLQAAF
jgi:hypothetical protein